MTCLIALLARKEQRQVTGRRRLFGRWRVCTYTIVFWRKRQTKTDGRKIQCIKKYNVCKDEGVRLGRRRPHDHTHTHGAHIQSAQYLYSAHTGEAAQSLSHNAHTHTQTHKESAFWLAAAAKAAANTSSNASSNARPCISYDMQHPHTFALHKISYRMHYTQHHTPI